MYLVCINLAFVTFSDMVQAICIHGQPIVAGSENFLSQGMPIYMCTKWSFVDFSMSISVSLSRLVARKRLS